MTTVAATIIKNRDNRLLSVICSPVSMICRSLAQDGIGWNRDRKVGDSPQKHKTSKDTKEYFSSVSFVVLCFFVVNLSPAIEVKLVRPSGDCKLRGESCPSCFARWSGRPLHMSGHRLRDVAYCV